MFNDPISNVARLVIVVVRNHGAGALLEYLPRDVIEAIVKKATETDAVES